MATPRELNETRVELAAQIKSMADAFAANDNEWVDATQEANWNKLNADYDATMASLQKAEKAREIVARAQELAEMPMQQHVQPNGSVLNNSSRRATVSAEEQRCVAFNNWIRSRAANLDEEQYHDAKSVGINLNASGHDFGLLTGASYNNLQRSFKNSHPSRYDQFFNAPLTSTTGSSGKFTVPAETFLRNIEVNMLAFGSVMQVADVITTSTGEPLTWPTVDDTSNTGRLIAESTAADDNAGGGTSGDGGPNPTFAQFQLTDYRYTSDTILVPYELLQDTAIDLTSLLGEMIGQRLGRSMEAAFTTGTGTGQPAGIVTGSTAGVTSGSTTAFVADDVISLQHSVDPAYRPGASFMAHDSVVAYIRKLKDSNGAYLWQSGLQSGTPDTLLGTPLYINQQMSSAFTTGQRLLLYGQMSKYKIRRVGAIRFYRLEERYREKDQDGFVAFVRADGKLLSAGTVPVKHLKLA